jgi:hypothetical protein
MKTFCSLLAVFEIALVIYLSVKTDLIRDVSPTNPNQRPYSLARTQLLWWTTIITVCYIIGYGQKGVFDTLNNTCLILLGISLTTTASARIIDGTQATTQLSRHQDQPTEHFLIDILSDENGISIHRFQTVLFNLLFGVSFLVLFFQNYVFPDFSTEQMTLLGISSSAYVGLKLTENATTSPAAATTRPAANTSTTTDEVFDADVVPHTNAAVG